MLSNDEGMLEKCPFSNTCHQAAAVSAGVKKQADALELSQHTRRAQGRHAAWKPAKPAPARPAACPAGHGLGALLWLQRPPVPAQQGQPQPHIEPGLERAHRQLGRGVRRGGGHCARLCAPRHRGSCQACLSADSCLHRWPKQHSRLDTLVWAVDERMRTAQTLSGQV